MSQDPSDDWHELPAEPLPRPTTAPFFTALGITLLFWGLIGSVVMIAVGLVVLAAALTSWIASIARSSDRHE